MTIPLLTLVMGAVLGITGYLWLSGLLTASTNEAPANVVIINDRLASSGQPSPEQLNGLADDGYEMLINLAPPTSLGSVADEGARLDAAGQDRSLRMAFDNLERCYII